MSKISDKQRTFIREYCLDKNATQAAIRAGYSPKTAQEQSSRLLSNVIIRQSVDDALAKLSEKCETDAAWVRRRLKEEADDHTESSTHAGRIRAVELIGKLNGQFVDRSVSLSLSGDLDRLGKDELLAYERAIDAQFEQLAPPKH